VDYRISMAVIAVALLIDPLTNMEGFAADNPEATGNIASVFNKEHLIVSNLTVTGDTKLGDLNVRKDRIGVEGRGDMQFRDDGNMYYLKYDTTDYNDGSMRTKNLYADNEISTHNNGKITSKTITSKSLSSDKITSGSINVPSKGKINMESEGIINFKNGGDIYGAANYIWHKPINTNCCGAVRDEKNSSVAKGVKNGSVAMGLHINSDTIRFQMSNIDGKGFRSYMKPG